jgi:flavin reductase (DIM6/NTAB) family NADH-FMN oxidoreductase RutF
MTDEFIEINPESINDNVIKLIGSDWMLISAGQANDYNTMTAAWGGLGFLWKMPVSYIFVRPQRYTFQFIEKNEYFSLCFFSDQYKDMLTYCGTYSGREVNKADECGLSLQSFQDKCVFFREANLVLICKKIYADDIDPEKFIDPALHLIYPQKDYHRMYIGKIESCFVKN